MVTNWLSAGAAVLSALMAVLSFVFARLSNKKAKQAEDEADKAARTLNDIETERNKFLANFDKRDEIREGAQPWEITNEGEEHRFRARNKLNVPLYDVDIASGEELYAIGEETPIGMVKDGESFTFTAIPSLNGSRRVSIIYSLTSGGEQTTFSDPLPSAHKT